MFRLVLLLCILLLLNGCATGYPSWKYRCYETTLQADADVPPMPNCRENNKTLGGIDSDNDGVRDDIQRYIAGIEIENDFFKRGLTQYARALNTVILEHDLEERAQLNFAGINLSLDCVGSSNMPPDVPDFTVFDIRDELRDIHLNTFERRFAYSHWRSYLKTQLVPLVKPKDACNFDITKFSGERMQ